MEDCLMFSNKQDNLDGPCLCPECSAVLANNFHFVEIHSHVEQEIIIVDIIHKIAAEKNKSPQKIKKLLLEKCNIDIINRFWEILDETLPNHKYNYVGYCYCGAMDLKE